MEVSQPASADDRRYQQTALFPFEVNDHPALCRPLSRLRITRLSTWGSAALHPRLYAIACSAG